VRASWGGEDVRTQIVVCTPTERAFPEIGCATIGLETLAATKVFGIGKTILIEVAKKYDAPPGVQTQRPIVAQVQRSYQILQMKAKLENPLTHGIKFGNAPGSN
jgi:hypothetical protein